MSQVAIHDFLPHRAPMLMVDYIDDIGEDHVVCSFIVLPDNIFCQEGFFQEVGLVENMAQTCSSIVGQTYYAHDYDPASDLRIVGFISGIKSLRIDALPKVGDHLKTAARLSARFQGDDYSICTMRVEVYVDASLYAEAVINLFLQEGK